MSLKSKSTQQLLLAASGANGTIPIATGAPVKEKSIAFEAWENSVIKSVLDSNKLERIGDIGWGTKQVDNTKTIYFGFEASSVELESGHGQLYRSEPPISE